MTDWVAFLSVAGLVTVLMLALARATAQMTTTADAGADTDAGTDAPDETDAGTVADSNADDATDAADRNGAAPEASERPRGADPPVDHSESDDRSIAVEGPSDRDPAAARGEAVDVDSLSTGALLANVAVTHGLFGAGLVGAAWLTDVPAGALGVEATPSSTGLPALAVGVALGVALYAANALAAANLDRFGVEFDEALRGMLSPDSLRGWLVLLAVVLPVIALFEELLFRAALIGAASTGLGVSPWLAALLSSVAFGLGHGIQGPGGVLVTGTLGFVLAAAFVYTGSLLTVVVAHYLVNVLEFVVHEGLGVELTGRSGGDGQGA